MSVVASPTWTAKEDEKLHALAMAGKSANYIAVELDRSVSAVRRRATVRKNIAWDVIIARQGRAGGEGEMTLWLDIASAMLAVGAAVFRLSQRPETCEIKNIAAGKSKLGEGTMTPGPFERDDLLIATVAGLLAWSITLALRALFGT